MILLETINTSHTDIEIYEICLFLFITQILHVLFVLMIEKLNNRGNKGKVGHAVRLNKPLIFTSLNINDFELESVFEYNKSENKRTVLIKNSDQKLETSTIDKLVRQTG